MLGGGDVPHLPCSSVRPGLKCPWRGVTPASHPNSPSINPSPMLLPCIRNKLPLQTAEGQVACRTPSSPRHWRATQEPHLTLPPPPVWPWAAHLVTLHPSCPDTTVMGIGKVLSFGLSFCYRAQSGQELGSRPHLALPVPRRPDLPTRCCSSPGLPTQLCGRPNPDPQPLLGLSGWGY